MPETFTKTRVWPQAARTGRGLISEQLQSLVNGHRISERQRVERGERPAEGLELLQHLQAVVRVGGNKLLLRRS